MPKQIDDDVVITIRAMHHGGYSGKQIALSLGIANSTVSKYLADMTRADRLTRLEKRREYETQRSGS